MFRWLLCSNGCVKSPGGRISARTTIYGADQGCSESIFVPTPCMVMIFEALCFDPFSFSLQNGLLSVDSASSHAASSLHFVQLRFCIFFQLPCNRQIDFSGNWDPCSQGQIWTGFVLGQSYQVFFMVAQNDQTCYQSISELQTCITFLWALPTDDFQKKIKELKPEVRRNGPYEDVLRRRFVAKGFRPQGLERDGRPMNTLSLCVAETAAQLIYSCIMLYIDSVAMCCHVLSCIAMCWHVLPCMLLTNLISSHFEFVHHRSCLNCEKTESHFPVQLTPKDWTPFKAARTEPSEKLYWRWKAIVSPWVSIVQSTQWLVPTCCFLNKDTHSTFAEGKKSCCWTLSNNVRCEHLHKQLSCIACHVWHPAQQNREELLTVVTSLTLQTVSGGRENDVTPGADEVSGAVDR